MGGEISADALGKCIKFVDSVGGCEMVKSQLKELEGRGVTTVRGLVDRDAAEKKRVSEGRLVVLGDGDFYAIENIVFNPICTILQSNYIDPKRFPILNVCGENIAWDDWLKSPELLQTATDSFFESVFDSKNRQDYTLEFLGGDFIKLDKRYMDFNGHELAAEIFKKYDVLQRLGKGVGKVKEAAIMKDIVLKSMIHLTGGRFIPLALCESIRRLQ